MRESLLITGTIAVVASAAAIVSAPAIMNRVGTHSIPSIPAPTSVFPTTGPLAAIATPAQLPPPLPPPPVPERPPASTTAPVIKPGVVASPGISAPVAPPGVSAPVSLPAPVEPSCLIGLVLNPLLGICVG